MYGLYPRKDYGKSLRKVEIFWDSLAGSGQDPQNLQKSRVFMDPWWNNQKSDQINDKFTTILGIKKKIRNFMGYN